MPSKVFLAARSIGEAVGLPTTLAIVLLIVVPILVIGSTFILCIYFFKARSSKRERTRSASKSSQNTASTEDDQEMALNALGSTFRPPTSTSSQHSIGFVAPMDRRVIAGHVKGAGSEVFDVHQYETERANQRSRDMILPSPTTSPIRPRTAPTNGRQEQTFPEFKPIDYNRPVNYESPGFNPYVNESNQRDHPNQSARLQKHRRSNSLGKPAPIRPPRPTHSPAGSVRSLSIFPHRHILPNSPGLSTPTSQLGHTSPSLSPSPPLLSPLPYGSRSPPPSTRPRQHVRHPSVDRNSFMPIAPILIPDLPPVLPSVDERSQSAQSHWGYEGGPRTQGHYRNGSVRNYI